jgi:hypothetical protein
LAIGQIGLLGCRALCRGIRQIGLDSRHRGHIAEILRRVESGGLAGRLNGGEWGVSRPDAFCATVFGGRLHMVNVRKNDSENPPPVKNGQACTWGEAQ